MPRCKNCGNRVSMDYARVMWSTTDNVPACPECPDKKLSNGREYEYRT